MNFTSFFRFRVSTIFVAVLVVAVFFAWQIDRYRLLRTLAQRDSRILLDAFQFASERKHNQWGPSSYLDADSKKIEGMLSHSLKSPTGDHVESNMGWSRGASIMLRRPSEGTTDAVIDLLQDDEVNVRILALQLVALYSEGFASAPTYGEAESAKTHFRRSISPHVLEMLSDSNAKIRAYAALAIGLTAIDTSAVEKLTLAYKNEIDAKAKSYMAWAIAKQFGRE